VTDMNLYEAKDIGANLLFRAGVPDYDFDATELLEFVCKKRYFGNGRDPMTPEQEEEYLNLLALREKRVPLQHIIGNMYFFGYPFHTREGVLIPRYDTECVVQKALDVAPDRKIRFLDLCTGSGCIGISFWRRRYRSGFTDTGVLTDISPEALSLAKENMEIERGYDGDFGESVKVLCDNVEVIASDLFEALEGQRFDLIISNPPYIAVSEMEDLMPEVRDHDPRLALTDEGDGLSFYRRIAAEAKTYLKPDGYLVLEIGYDQGEAVPELLGAEGFGKVEVSKDLAGLDRVVTAHR